jgi:hypothetical protein
MNTLAQDLRHAASEIRRRPYPISDLIPLLQRAADQLDALEDELEDLSNNNFIKSYL